MKRAGYIQKLKEWRGSPRRKPLVLEGARQVGKTWLMREFAKEHFQNVVFLRFDRDSVLKSIFARDFDVTRIVRDLEIRFRTKIEPDNTILLFDEIQACPDALTSLKYFCEDRPDLPIIAAGSLLGLEYRDDDGGNVDERESPTTGFPVGKVNLLPVCPMSFTEFLVAVGDERLAESIVRLDWETLNVFDETLADRLRHYYVVGGMPEAVASYSKSGRLMDAREVHREILTGYRRDISKHAPKSEVRKVEACWQSIPVQLAKENKRFAYSVLKKGGRASEFRDPLAWLEDAGLVCLNRRVKTPRLPLKAYADGAFKAYLLDVGLLSSLSGLAPEAVLEGSRVFSEFKGALTEQFVFQQLKAETSLAPHYWSTDDSRTEVDFVFQDGMRVVPLEVKAERNVHSQSLKSYLRRFAPKIALRASMLPYREQDVPIDGGGFCKLVNVPLFAAGAIERRLHMA